MSTRQKDFTLGVAYYPEHWDESLWERDLKMMKEAGITAVRVAEFSWGRVEPKDGVFDFSWLNRFNSLAKKYGIGLILCTPTEAPPPWLWRKHPEILPVDVKGLTYGASGRRHGCINSPVFNLYSDRITEALARQFGNDSNVLGWQLDNEAGCHINMKCYCPACQREFRIWVEQTYKTVERVNQEWGLVFWSGEIDSFNEVVLHHNHITLSNPGYELAVQRFASDSWIRFLERQAKIIRQYSKAPITHNVTWYAEQIDIFKLGQVLDVIGIDIYQRRPELVTMIGDMFYSAKKAPFWVMEMGASSWKVPVQDGVLRGDKSVKATIIKHMLQGASLCSIFRWRSSPCGGEMETGSGGLNYHDGSPTPSYNELKKSSPLINKLYEELPQKDNASVAIVLDYTDYFMIYSTPRGRRNDSSYYRTKTDYYHDMLNYHQVLSEKGIRCDFIHEREELDGYKMVIIPEKWTMDEELADKYKRYVSQGGVLVAADRFGAHTRNGRMTCVPLPGFCTDLFGVYFNEFFSPEDIGASMKVEIEGQGFEVKRQVSPLKVKDAMTLGVFNGGSYNKMAAITCNKFGKGSAYYIGALMERDGVRIVLNKILDMEGINRPKFVNEQMSEQCEMIVRGDIVAFFNHTSDQLVLTPNIELYDFETGKRLAHVEISPLDCTVCRFKRGRY